jgi:2,3-bisphosphoglycerate-independent phosphoglycerate mutase
MRALLLILDGAGLADEEYGNAVTPATMPYLFALMRDHGHAVLDASGPAVGLEVGAVGNSEVGHLTIGAGRTVPSMLSRIGAAYADGAWERHPLWGEIAQHPRLHVIGLLSDAGVHGHWSTMVQAAELAARRGVRDILLHPFLDGVDSVQGSAPALLEQLTQSIRLIPGARLGVIQGRRAFTDRSGNLEVSRNAVRGLVDDRLPAFRLSDLAAHYPTPEADFPAHLAAGGSPVAAGEPVLLTSHRSDRALQAARVLSETQTVYSVIEHAGVIAPEHAFFPSTPLDSGLAFEFQRRGIRSLRIAEQCKFPHVTYFFNGFNPGLEGREICVPSLPDRLLKHHPEMSLPQITAAVLSGIARDEEQVIVANLANLDQIGHLGDYDLAVEAARRVDEALRTIHLAAHTAGWTVIVTSDHGNADLMCDPQGNGVGSHSTRPVPLVVAPERSAGFAWRGRTGTLANVAASLLQLLGLDAPDWMAPSLVDIAPRPRRVQPS